MPRVSTKALLRDLQALNVRRYVREGSRIEVEFWSPSGVQPLTAEDRRERYLEDRQRKDFEKNLRDPLFVATEEISVDDEGAN